MKCIHLSDDFTAVCVNADCPVCCDFCPCLNYPEICKYAEGEDNESMRDEPRRGGKV